jgi:hypothetical protein
MLWKKIALVLVPVALIVGATLPAAAGAEEVMTQQQAQEMLSTYGEEGLINMGLSAEQLKNLKIIASGGTVQQVVVSSPPVTAPTDGWMTQQQAQEMLSTYGEVGLINMGLSAEQLGHLKFIAGGGTYQTEIASPPVAEPVQSTPLMDALTARNLLNNFGVAGLLGMGLTLEQVSLIQLAAGNF